MGIWQNFGFRDNPYNPLALSTSKEDYELFVGRVREGEKLKINASTGDRAIMIVEGDVGVGKTSFINIQQRNFWQKLYPDAPYLLPSFQTIQLRSDMTTADFILSVLSNILFSLKIIKKEIEKEETFQYINSLVNQQIDSRTGFSVGGGVYGFSGQVGWQSVTTVTQPIAVVTQSLINAVADAYTFVKSLGFEGIFVPINNIDILEEGFVINFLNEIRDLFLTQKGYWSTLIAGRGFFSILEINAPRLSEMFSGRPIIIGPLKLEEVLEAINKRIEKLGLSPEIHSPLSDGIIKLLYELSKGQIRYLFKRATDLMLQFKTEFPSATTITNKQAFNLLRIISHERIKRLYLTKTEMQILEAAVSLRKFRPKDFAKFNFRSSQALYSHLKKLEEYELLSKTGDPENAKAKIYMPSGDVQLLMGKAPDYLKI